MDDETRENDDRWERKRETLMAIQSRMLPARISLTAQPQRLLVAVHFRRVFRLGQVFPPAYDWRGQFDNRTIATQSRESKCSGTRPTQCTLRSMSLGSAAAHPFLRALSFRVL